MAIRKIFKLGEPVLKQKAKPVSGFDAKLQQLVKDLFQTMYNAPGVGLAANQIGVASRVCVVDTSPDGIREPFAFVNPEITYKSGGICQSEGCLSVPGIFEKVKRAAKIKVRAYDEFGREFTLDAQGLLAIAIQHEIDHLNGIVFVDRLTPLRKIKARMQIKKLKKEMKW